jgi:hypothetical protein
MDLPELSNFVDELAQPSLAVISEIKLINANSSPGECGDGRLIEKSARTNSQ